MSWEETIQTVEMNDFWIPNYEIHKRVIQEYIQYYLGPGSTVRPFTRNGEDGFLISTPGEYLTDEQIDDICLKSKERWEKEAAARIQRETDRKLKRPAQQPIPMARGAGVGTGSISAGSRNSHLDRPRRRRSDDRDGSKRRSDDRRRDRDRR